MMFGLATNIMIACASNVNAQSACGITQIQQDAANIPEITTNGKVAKMWTPHS